MPVSFGGTLSGGIQDISALLPLLGTEQVAKHVGSSLHRGYLYAAAAPLSIFGSLGQVQAGFAIGLASVPSYHGFGARLLKDAGFDPTGEAIKMITLEQGKYVAEIRFKTASKALLVNKSLFFLGVRSADHAQYWNISLTFFSFFAASLSFIPYLHFIIRHDTSRPLLAWLFPLIRAFGALCCVIAGQFLLQNRIVTILQQQVQFTRFDKHMKSGNLFHQAMRIFPYERNIWMKAWRRLQIWRTDLPRKVAIQWGDDATCEECLWDLYCYMKSLPSNDSTLAQLCRFIGDGDLNETQSIEKLKKEFLPHAVFNMTCQLAIFVGMLASIVGYIGCFSILQDGKTSATGRCLWVGLEATLAIGRMLVWAWNPKYDNSSGLELSLERDVTPTSGSQFDRLPASSLRHPSADGTVTFDLIDNREFVSSFLKTYGSFPPSKLSQASFAIYYTKLRKSMPIDTVEIYITVLDIARNQAFLCSTLETKSEYPFTLHYATLDPRQMSVSWHPTRDLVPDADAMWRNHPLIQELIICCNILMKTINNKNERVDQGVQMDWLGTPRITQPLVMNVALAWLPIRSALWSVMVGSVESAKCRPDIFSDFHAALWVYFGYKQDVHDFAEFAGAAFRKKVQELLEDYFLIQELYQKPILTKEDILVVLEEYHSGLSRIKDCCGAWGLSGSMFVSQIRQSIDEWASGVWFNSLPPPSRNETLSAAIHDSANTLAAQFEYTHRAADLNHAISLYRKSLMILPPLHNMRSASLNSLATVLHMRFQEIGQQSDLDDAIQSCNIAHRLSPSTSSLTLLKSLAAALQTRSKEMHRLSDLDRAIELLRRFLGAVEVSPHPLQDHSASFDDLASMLRIRFVQGGGQRSDLDEAILLHRRALVLRPRGHTDRSVTLNNLADVLRARVKQGGGPSSDLEEVILLLRQALNLRPLGHPERSNSLNSLAIVLQTRFEQEGDQASNLDEIILLHRQALELRPPGHPDRSMSLNNLAIVLHICLEQGGAQATSTDEVILLNREALELRPPGHPDRSMSLNNLATVLHTRFKQGGVLATDLDEVVLLHRRALELRPLGHPDRSQSLNNLAIALHTCFEQGGSQASNLDEVILLHRQALELCPPGHLDRSSSLSNLASALQTRFEKGYGQASDLDEVIIFLREALDLRPLGHLGRSMSLNNLANVLHTRLEQANNQANDLDEVILLHREALGLRPAEHPDRSMSLNNLAIALKTRFDQGGFQASDLDEIIFLNKQALEIRSPGHPDRSQSLNNLAIGLQTRFEQGSGQAEDLDEIILLNTQALELRPPGHPDRSQSLDNLANVLHARFLDGGGQENDLDQAILLLRQALELRPLGHPDRSGSLNNLAGVLHTHFDQGGSQANGLGEVILLNRQALELCPPGHLNRSTSLNNLANALQARLERGGGQGSDLDEVVSLHREALELRPSGHPDRSVSLNNLANVLQTRFKQGGGEANDLDEAIILHREGLEICSPGHPNRSTSLNNLANALQTHFEQGGRQINDLEEAIVLSRQALVLCPPGHTSRCYPLDTLASALLTRFEHGGGHSRDLGEALSFLQQALELCSQNHPNRPYSLNTLANVLRIRFEHGGGQTSDLDEAISFNNQALELRPTNHPDRGISLNTLANVLYTRFQLVGSDASDLDKAIALTTEALQLRAPGHPNRSESLNLAKSLANVFEEGGRKSINLDRAIALWRE